MIKIKNDINSICQCVICKNCNFNIERGSKLCEACYKNIHKF